MDPHKDHRYIEALRTGDETLIEEIYAKFSPAIISYVCSNSGDVEDARDVFQEALISLFHAAERGFILTKPFKIYFGGMCRYIWLDKIKERKNRRKKEAGYKEVTNLKKIGNLNEANFEEILLKEAEYNLFIEKFKSLSPHCQEIIGLSWTKNEKTGKILSLKEIALQLDRSYGYIRKEKANCVKRLKQLITVDPKYQSLKNMDLWMIDKK